jgi:hypothetical protein
LPITSLVGVIKSLEKQLPNVIVFSDNSGIKNVQFLTEVDEIEVLNNYYNSL